MKIGIGTPAMIPSSTGPIILDWARKADDSPFSTLAALDRIVFPNHEALTTLAACAALTTRVRLITTVLIATIRKPAILAKQAATIDVLSNGRLTLGLGVGSRDSDFIAAPASYHDRGKRMDAQLDLMKQIWSGEPVSGDIGPVGPLPVQEGGPELLLGGRAEAALKRAGRASDGYIGGGSGDPAAVQAAFQIVKDARKEAGRSGEPRLVGTAYYALGPDTSAGADYIRQYYPSGPFGEQAVKGILSTPERITDTIKAFEDIGMDEFILWPTIAELDQFDRLAEVVS